jgi:hypothetical protein
MADEFTPSKRPRRPKGKAIRKDRDEDLADLDDAEIAERVLGTKWARDPVPRPLWLKVLLGLGLVVCVIVFPLGLCVLCTWLMCRYPPSSVRHRLYGVRVVGRVVNNDVENDYSSDGPWVSTYQATVEYTFKGIPYTTPDGPKRNRWPFRRGEAALIYHIPEDCEPGRAVGPGVVFGYAVLIVLVNLVVFAVGLWGAEVLWGALTGGGAP